jgi:nitrogen regulatory protein P-II 1
MDQRFRREVAPMRKIEAIIRVSAFEEVRDALDRIGIEGLTLSEVHGFGHEPGHAASYRGTTYVVDSLSRLRLEIVAPDAQAGPIAHAIAKAARSGRVGDGLVTIQRVEEAVRIRTGERGVGAVTSSNEVDGEASAPRHARPQLAAASLRR